MDIIGAAPTKKPFNWKRALLITGAVGLGIAVLYVVAIVGLLVLFVLGGGMSF